jgi:hypothetical protein
MRAELRKSKERRRSRPEKVPGKLKIFMEILQIGTCTTSEKKLIMRNKANNQQDSRRKTDGRRNIPGGGLVYTSAAGRAAQASQRNYKKNPAVAAAGR